MQSESSSAIAAVRALRDQLRARLDQNEEYRAWKALDDVMRELEPRTLPRAVDLAVASFESSRSDDLKRA